jgi:hypothetical protein
MANPSLYIACGGSGCKTIQSLTELIAQDPDLRYAFNNRIFYVLIDTEEEQLERTERLIRNQIPNCTHKHQRFELGKTSASSLRRKDR